MSRLLWRSEQRRRDDGEKHGQGADEARERRVDALLLHERGSEAQNRQKSQVEYFSRLQVSLKEEEPDLETKTEKKETVTDALVTERVPEKKPESAWDRFKRFFS